jgi:hypothetical protein
LGRPFLSTMANKYRYPKGHPKAGQFQPGKEGARQFVRENFNDIAAGDSPIKKLSTLEKRIYAGLKGNDYGNRFNFGTEKIYDPTGALKTYLKSINVKKQTTDLNTVLPKKAKEVFLDLYNADNQFADDKKRVTFIKGKLNELKSYKTKSGELLDVLKLVEKYEKKGFKLKLSNLQGKASEGAQAVLNLTKYENRKIAQMQKKHKDKFIRMRFEYNPVINSKKKTITIKLKKTTFQDLSNTP